MCSLAGQLRATDVSALYSCMTEILEIILVVFFSCHGEADGVRLSDIFRKW